MHVDKSKFAHRGETTTKALDVGVPILLIDPIVEEKWPKLLGCLMDADNVTNQIANDDTDMALLFKINRIAQTLKQESEF